jgi:hypothetical protein
VNTATRTTHTTAIYPQPSIPKADLWSIALSSQAYCLILPRSCDELTHGATEAGQDELPLPAGVA